MTGEGWSPAALAERYVIGSMLRDPRVLRDVQAEVVPGDFEDGRLGAIYAGVLRMATEREPIDYLTVSERLAGWDVRGLGLTELAAWADGVPSASSAGYYARLIRDAAIRRAVGAEAERLTAASTGTGPDAGVVLMEAIERLQALRDRDGDTAAGVRTLRDVLGVPEDADRYDWVIPDVLERSDRLMLTGSEGGGKSTMLRQIVVLAAAGVHPFTFKPMPPVRCLVIDAENSERQWRRAVRGMADRAAMQGARDPRDFVALECSPKTDVTHATTLGRIHRRIDDHAPDLVLIGPLYRLVGGKPIDKDTEVAPVLGALDSIRDRGVAMLIEAHAGHASSQTGVRDLRPRGSSALLGWPEFGLGLRRDKGERQGPDRSPRFSLVRWRGDRDVRDFPTRFTRGTSWPWEPTVHLG